MPLFECSKCHCIENTALCNYWWNVKNKGMPALCSECDSEIGEWHNVFAKRPAAEMDTDERGFLIKKEEPV